MSSTTSSFIAFATSLLLALVVGVATPIKADAQAYCLKCTSTTGGTCDVDRADAGYHSCSCPCECSNPCNQTELSLEELLRDPSSLPTNGVRVLGVTEASTVRYTGGHGGGRAFFSAAYFGERFGLVAMNDGSWRAFPLDGQDTFVLRACDGRFLTRVRRSDGSGPGTARSILARLSEAGV